MSPWPRRGTERCFPVFQKPGCGDVSRRWHLAGFGPQGARNGPVGIDDADHPEAESVRIRFHGRGAFLYGDGRILDQRAARSCLRAVNRPCSAGKSDRRQGKRVDSTAVLFMNKYVVNRVPIRLTTKIAEKSTHKFLKNKEEMVPVLLKL